VSLRKLATSGVKWTAASTVITTVLQFFQLTVLARLLEPQVFGLMAMMLVVIGFGQAFSDMGVSNAIICKQDVSRDHLSTLYWANFIAGMTVFGLVMAIRPFVAYLYNEPSLGGLIPWMALIFLITPIGQQFQSLLQKELRFDLLAQIDVVATVIGTVVVVFMAVRGEGVFSLILGRLSNALSKSIMLACVGWKEWSPSMRFNRADLKGYLAFGLFQMGERSINYFNERLDQLLIGTLLGAQALGYYVVAFNLVIQPISRLNPILTKVAFPVFSKAQSNTGQLKRGYLFLLNILMSANSPMLLGLASTAPLLLPLIFGERWLPAVPLVQILSFVALFMSSGNSIGCLLLAKGRADLAFKWNAALFLSQIPTIYFCARHGGAMGVAVGLLVLQTVYFIANYLILVCGLLGPCMKEYLMSVVPSFCLASIMGIAVSAILFFIKGPAELVLTAQLFTGVCVYVVLTVIFRPAFLKEIKSFVFV